MPVATTNPKSSPVLIAIAWAAVVLPAAWGFRYTVESALKIFTAAPPAATQPTPAKR